MDGRKGESRGRGRDRRRRWKEKEKRESEQCHKLMLYDRDWFGNLWCNISINTHEYNSLNKKCVSPGNISGHGGHNIYSTLLKH